MKRRLICALATVVLALYMPIAALAHPVLDWDQNGRGSLRIDLDYGQTADPGSLVVLQVGVVQEENGDCAFVPTEDFAGAWEAGADLQDPALSEALAEKAEALNLSGVTVEVSKDGTVLLENLEFGLYLVMQGRAAAGYEAINPFLIGVPNLKDGVYTYRVDASPKVSPEPVPTEPPAPTEPPPTRPTEPYLPQTGQTNWPVPVMAAAGLLLFIMGWSLCFRDRKERHEN